MNRMPVAAIMYDFDRTLCTKDMQDYSFIPRLNMTEDEFWKFSNELGQSEHMDSILAYMYAMVKMSRERNMPLLRNDLVEMGKNVEFFDGVKDWFKRISDFGEKLESIRRENLRQLDEMRQTVDEKLQKTLEEKMNKSFSLVNERLEQVYKGLGEMQTLAVGVGDLKKVLSNVKTRGILGEIQLGAILSEILTKEQYEENIATKKGSKNVVEFAIKLPSDGAGTVYLPVDSKFPGDTYSALRDAVESCDKQRIESAQKALVQRIKGEAKDIHDKYIDPPNTTEFAIMFLPFEGLYSEVVNMGLVEVLQREYKVNIAGPSTMAALLNSLQMGFKTLAVQKRSAEVWKILGGVKTEFDKFNDVLVMTQQRLDQANKELDKLVGVRTRQIQRQLKDVESVNLSEQNLFE